VRPGAAEEPIDNARHLFHTTHMADTPSYPVAVVTGASSGIGEAVARELAQRKYLTVLMARRADRLDALSRSLAQHAPCEPVTVDLADRRAVGEAIAGVLRAHPRVEVLVNNAGYSVYAPFLEQAEAEQRRLMDVNYWAASLLIRAVLPGMLERGKGHIINLGSIATKWGPWGHSGYTAAKCALVALTQSLALDYVGQGVHFSYVNPGVVKTEFFQHPSYAPLARQVERHGVSTGKLARAIAGLLDRPRIELCYPRHYRVLDWLRVLSPSFTQWLVWKGSRTQPGRAG